MNLKLRCNFLALKHIALKRPAQLVFRNAYVMSPDPTRVEDISVAGSSVSAVPTVGEVAFLYIFPDLKALCSIGTSSSASCGSKLCTLLNFLVSVRKTAENV